MNISVLRYSPCEAVAMRSILGTKLIRWGLVLAVITHLGSGVAAAQRLEERHVASIRDFEDAAISPNGDKVALYIVDPLYRDASGVPVQSRLETRDVASLTTDSIVNLPDSVIFSSVFRWSKPMPKVLYCNGSKYILVYLGDGVSTVIETATGRTHTIAPEEPPKRTSIGLAASCAAQGDVIAFDLLIDRGGVNRVELFDLRDGKKVKEIPVGISRGQYVGVDVSPSGDHVLTYMMCKEDTVCVKLSTDVHVFDTQSGTVVKTINAGFPVGRASFAGDSSIAVVSGDPRKPEARHVKIFSLQTGALISNVGDRSHAPSAFTSASADGRRLLAYTGKENRCENCNLENRGSLQIRRAQFTVWDLASGKVIAQSPGIPSRTIRGGILEDGKNLRANERPQFQFSDSGNAVLVTHARDLSAVSVFLLRQEK